MWECEWWRLFKTTKTVKHDIREHFPYRRSLAAEQLLQEIKTRKLFGYVQCDIEVPENLRSNYDNFHPIFKQTLVSKIDVRETCWKTMRKRKDYCLNLGYCWYSAPHYKMEHSLLLCCCLIYNWFLFAQKYTVLLGTLQRRGSTALCSQQWTQEGKVTKIQT